jgi:hypothetical protein
VHDGMVSSVTHRAKLSIRVVFLNPVDELASQRSKCKTITPTSGYRPSEDQAQDPHILRAIGRAWGWRRRMDACEFATIQELAEAVGLAERHVSRQLRLAYLAPEVLKRLTCGREASAVSLYDLCFLAGKIWGEQVGRIVGE